MAAAAAGGDAEMPGSDRNRFGRAAARATKHVSFRRTPVRSGDFGVEASPPTTMPTTKPDDTRWPPSTGATAAAAAAIVDDKSSWKTSLTPEQKKTLVDSLTNNIDAMENEMTCKICLDSEVCVVYAPCGHLVCCKKCSEKITKCPVCRDPIYRKVYVKKAQKPKRKKAMDTDLLYSMYDMKKFTK